jgi:hypothetical protein
MSEYPEHDKMMEIAERRDEVQHFLDWMLDEAGLTLAFYGSDNGYGDIVNEGRLYAASGADPRLRLGKRVTSLRETLLARFFDIDLVKLGEEKKAMLAALRKANDRAA